MKRTKKPYKAKKVKRTTEPTKKELTNKLLGLGALIFGVGYLIVRGEKQNKAQKESQTASNNAKTMDDSYKVNIAVNETDDNLPVE